jgi:hypothetical protein
MIPMLHTAETFLPAPSRSCNAYRPIQKLRGAGPFLSESQQNGRLLFLQWKSDCGNDGNKSLSVKLYEEKLEIHYFVMISSIPSIVHAAEGDDATFC